MTNSTSEPPPLPQDVKDVADRSRTRDPFPRIPPALLNSADIQDYAVSTRMIYPFDANRLKSASYSVCVGEKIICWEGTADGGKYKHIPVKHLSPGEAFSIPKNSLVFIQTAEIFLLPYYIAARFNLQISLVHKGLLLGTGPLVDPGFRGELLVPLHNLTENDYALCRGDEFIWVEFTKLSPNVIWDDAARAIRDSEKLIGKYREYQERHGSGDKLWPSAEDYISRALQSENRSLSPHRSIRNSWPKEVEDFRLRIERVEAAADEAQTSVKRTNLAVVLIPLVAALVAYFGFVAPLLQAGTQAARAQDQVERLSNEIDEIKKALAMSGPESSTITNFSRRLDALESKPGTKPK